MKGATKIIVLAGMTKLDITIHAPMKGATEKEAKILIESAVFQSTRP